MNRRPALKTLLTASASARAAGSGRITAQEANAKTPKDVAGTIYLHPERGSDSNSGQKDSPLKTLAAAAWRVNEGKGQRAVMVLLAEGVYAVNEPALFKPANRSAVLFQGPVGKYNLAKSLFAANENLYGSGLGPPVNFKALPASAMELPSSSKASQKPVDIQLDQSKRDYLHVVAGAPGSEIGAGLFTGRA